MRTKTGFEAGLSGEEQIKIAVAAMHAGSGFATTATLYAAIEARMGGARLSHQGRSSVRFFINSVATRRGFVTKAEGGWRVTRAGLTFAGVRNDVADRIAVIASQEARKRARRGIDGAIIRRSCSYMDEDDVAQDAAVRALVAARRYDANRGTEAALAYVVAKSTVRDVRDRVTAQRALPRSGQADGGAVAERILYGDTGEEATSSLASFDVAYAHARVEERLAAHEAVEMVMASISGSRKRALTRWLEEGAEGPMEQRTGEARIRDARCAVRAVYGEASPW